VTHPGALIRLLALLVALIFPAAAFGQPATGPYPFGSFSSGTFDTVNNGNLNVHFEIPVVNKAGRQLPFYYNLSYDSLVWFPVGNGSNAMWTPVNTGTWGWRAITEAETGYVSYADLPTGCSGGGTWHKYYNWVYHDTFGVPHPFPSNMFVTTSAPCNTAIMSASGTTTDESGYTMSVTNAPAVSSLLSRFGTTISPPPLNSGTGNASFYDRNGNEITVTGNQFIDTLDTPNVPALTFSGNGNPSSPTTLSWTNPLGTTSSVTLNYTTYSVQTNFGCGFNDYGPFSSNLISSIGLPDGTSYTITYEPTPGKSGKVTGRIGSVTLPTGGIITYGLLRRQPGYQLRGRDHRHLDPHDTGRRLHLCPHGGRHGVDDHHYRSHE